MRQNFPHQLDLADGDGEGCLKVGICAFCQSLACDDLNRRFNFALRHALSDLTARPRAPGKAAENEAFR